MKQLWELLCCSRSDSSVCLARKHEIYYVTESLQLLEASYAKHGLKCRGKFYLNPWSVIQIFSLLLAEDKQQNKKRCVLKGQLVFLEFNCFLLFLGECYPHS